MATDLETALAKPDLDARVPRLVAAVVRWVPGGAELPTWTSLEDGAAALSLAPDSVTAARERLAEERTKRSLYALESLDGGADLVAVLSGLGGSLRLYLQKQDDGTRGGIAALDRRQRADAATKLYTVAWACGQLFGGDGATQLQALRAVPAGRALLAWVGAIELLLPFTEEVAAGELRQHIVAERDAARERFARAFGEAEAAAADVSWEMLLDAALELGSAGTMIVGGITSVVGKYLPSVVSAVDFSGAVTAGAFDALPVYHLLGARLVAEAALVGPSAPPPGLPVADALATHEGWTAGDAAPAVAESGADALGAAAADAAAAAASVGAGHAGEGAALSDPFQVGEGAQPAPEEPLAVDQPDTADPDDMILGPAVPTVGPGTFTTSGDEPRTGRLEPSPTFTAELGAEPTFTAEPPAFVPPPDLEEPSGGADPRAPVLEVAAAAAVAGVATAAAVAGGAAAGRAAIRTLTATQTAPGDTPPAASTPPPLPPVVAKPPPLPDAAPKPPPLPDAAPKPPPLPDAAPRARTSPAPDPTASGAAPRPPSPPPLPPAAAPPPSKPAPAASPASARPAAPAASPTPAKPAASPAVQATPAAAKPAPARPATPAVSRPSPSPPPPSPAPKRSGGGLLMTAGLGLVLLLLCGGVGGGAVVYAGYTGMIDLSSLGIGGSSKSSPPSKPSSPSRPRPGGRR